MLAAAALAGAVVYWRAGDRRRSRELAAEIDDGIAEGQRAARSVRGGVHPDDQQFDQR